MRAQSPRKSQSRTHARPSSSAPLLDSLEPRVLMSLTYAMLDLGNVGDGMGVWASSINNSGQVCGTIPLGAVSTSMMFRTQPNKAINGNTDWVGAAPTIHASGINASGQIAGTSVFNTLTDIKAFRTAPNGNLASNNLDIPAAEAGMDGVAINDSGQVVLSGGASFSSVYVTAANGSSAAPTKIAGDAANPASGYAINNAGQTVGWISHKSNGAVISTDAFVYSGGVISALRHVPLSADRAYGINSLGQICGDSRMMIGGRYGHFARHAILYTTTYSHRHLWTCSLTDLGSLGGDSTAYAINDSGVIVGSSTLTSTGTTPHAFVYINHAMVDLNTVVPRMHGWVLTSAVSINNKGQIACQAMNSGMNASCVLTPTLHLIH